MVVWDDNRVASPKPTKALQCKKRHQGNQIKYFVKVTHNVAEALQFDKDNGNNYWEVAIKKEMDTIMRLDTIQELKAGKGNMFQQDPEYQYTKVLLIFDIKADGRRKARLVLIGHMTKAPNVDLYASHMKQESLRILALIAAAYSMKTLIGDVKSAYLRT